MTFEQALNEASRRARVMTQSYAVVYAEYALATEANFRYMVIPLKDAESRDLLIVERVCIDVETALQHEEILAGLASERAHSRFMSANGQSIQWTYTGHRSMAKL